MSKLATVAAKKGMTVAEFVAAQTARRERGDDNLRREVEQFERTMGFDAPLSRKEAKRLHRQPGELAPQKTGSLD